MLENEGGPYFFKEDGINFFQAKDNLDHAVATNVLKKVID